MFLQLYISIGLVFSMIYTQKYIDDNQKIFRNVTNKQLIRAYLITFFITLLIYPFTILEELIKLILGKKRVEAISEAIKEAVRKRRVRK